MKIYLTVALCAAYLPRLELRLGPSLALIAIQVLYINQGAHAAL